MAAQPLPEKLAQSIGEFLNVYGQIKRLGMDGWIAAMGRSARLIDEDLAALVVMFESELDGLDFESDVRDAEQDARLHAAKK